MLTIFELKFNAKGSGSAKIHRRIEYQIVRKAEIFTDSNNDYRFSQPVDFKSQ